MKSRREAVVGRACFYGLFHCDSGGFEAYILNDHVIVTPKIGPQTIRVLRLGAYLSLFAILNGLFRQSFACATTIFDCISACGAVEEMMMMVLRFCGATPSHKIELGCLFSALSSLVPFLLS